MSFYDDLRKSLGDPAKRKVLNDKIRRQGEAKEAEKEQRHGTGDDGAPLTKHHDKNPPKQKEKKMATFKDLMKAKKGGVPVKNTKSGGVGPTGADRSQGKQSGPKASSGGARQAERNPEILSQIKEALATNGDEFLSLERAVRDAAREHGHDSPQHAKMQDKYEKKLERAAQGLYDEDSKEADDSQRRWPRGESEKFGPSAEKSESEKQEMQDRAGIREMKGRENLASLSAGDLKAKAAAQEAKTPGGSTRRMAIQDEPSATPAKEPSVFTEKEKALLEKYSGERPGDKKAREDFRAHQAAKLSDKESTKAGKALLDQANVHSATARRHEAEGRHEEAKKSHAMAADLKKKSDAVLGVGKKEAAPAAAPAKPSGMSGADKKAMHLSNSLKEQAGGFANMAKQHAAAGRTKEAAAAMAKSKSLVAQSQKVLGSGGAHPAEAQPKNLQTGKKGGQFYVTATGQKVYLGKKGG